MGVAASIPDGGGAPGALAATDVPGALALVSGEVAGHACGLIRRLSVCNAAVLGMARRRRSGYVGVSDW